MRFEPSLISLLIRVAYESAVIVIFEELSKLIIRFLTVLVGLILPFIIEFFIIIYKVESPSTKKFPSIFWSVNDIETKDPSSPDIPNS